MTARESSLGIVLSTAVTVATAAALSSAGGGWLAVRPQHWWLFAVSATFFVAAHFFLIEAYRHAQTVVVAPIRYTQIVWSVLAGMLLWGEVPHRYVLIGVAMSAGAGIYITWREARGRAH